MLLRVRPIFWLLFALSCAGVLIFATVVPSHAPALLQVHLDQSQPTASDITTVMLSLTDSQGLPIEQANIIPDATMTNMHMGASESHVKEIGQGKYVAEFKLNMAGPWAITILTHANGFETQSQTLQVEVS
ncbi:MAG TPA: FixH family protein [Ktedonosporobacter sp.]|nr:FixH family protein [Ktedonosporobacter sp.]